MNDPDKLDMTNGLLAYSHSATTTAITRRYHFEAAHFLPMVHDGHKCKRVHGHNYQMEVTVIAPVAGDGFIVDFWDLDKVVQPWVERVDHRCLNDIPGLDNPTAELIAAWFLYRIDVANVITIFETPDCWATARRRSD